MPDVCRAWRGGDDPGGGAQRQLLLIQKHHKGGDAGGANDNTVAHRCASWWCAAGCEALVQASRAPNEAAARATLPAALCGRCTAASGSSSLAGGGLGAGAGTLLNPDSPLAKKSNRKISTNSQENCSVRESAQHAEEGNLFVRDWHTHEARSGIYNGVISPVQVPNTQLRGAILTAWRPPPSSGPLKEPRIETKGFFCQNASRAKYAEAHGYAYYNVGGSADFERERERMGLDPRHTHLLKLQAARKFLPRHAWVMWMDNDAIFKTDRDYGSIEDQLETLGERRASAAAVWTPASRTGFFNSDTFIVFNRPWAYTYLDLVWNATRPTGGGDCPWGDGQCTMNLVNHGMLLAQMSRLVERGLLDDRVQLLKAAAASPGCCTVLDATSSRGVYECMRNWEAIFRDCRVPNQVVDPERPPPPPHRFLVRRPDFRHLIGIRHPVKKMDPERDCEVCA